MRRTRSNPQSADALEHPFVVLVRRFDPTGEELARWEPLVRDDDGRPEFFSEARARAAALNPPRDADLHVGDLATVVPVDALSAIDNQAHKLFVVTPDGIKAAPKVPKELGGKLPWTVAWGQNAYVMMSLSASVDRRRLVMAACDCAETALPTLTSGSTESRTAIEAARAWCFGRVSRDYVLDAGYRSSSAPWGGTAASLAAFSATNSRNDAAANSAANAALEAGLASDTDMREMAPLVERWIPLPVTLLSMLGYPDAIPFEVSARAPLGNDPRDNPRATMGRAHRKTGR